MIKNFIYYILIPVLLLSTNCGIATPKSTPIKQPEIDLSAVPTRIEAIINIRKRIGAPMTEQEIKQAIQELNDNLKSITKKYGEESKEYLAAIKKHKKVLETLKHLLAKSKVWDSVYEEQSLEDYLKKHQAGNHSF